MPKEKTTKAETTEEVVEAVSSKAAALKKAGVPTAVILLITLMSFPGVWEFFFNRTDDEAKVKAEVAYELLRVRAEGIAKHVEQQDAQIENLRETLNAMLLQRSAVGMSMLRPPPEPESQPEPPAAPVLKPLPANLDALVQRAME